MEGYQLPDGMGTAITALVTGVAGMLISMFVNWFRVYAPMEIKGNAARLVLLVATIGAVGLAMWASDLPWDSPEFWIVAVFGVIVLSLQAHQLYFSQKVSGLQEQNMDLANENSALRIDANRVKSAEEASRLNERDAQRYRAEAENLKQLVRDAEAGWPNGRPEDVEDLLIPSISMAK